MMEEAIQLEAAEMLGFLVQELDELILGEPGMEYVVPGPVWEKMVSLAEIIDEPDMTSTAREVLWREDLENLIQENKVE